MTRFPDHTDIEIGRIRPFRIEACDRFLEGLDEIRFHLLLDEKVVRRDAGLPRVEALAPDDAPCRDPQIGALVHDAGTLAAEFQYHGGQELSLRGSDDTGHGGASGVEKKIEACVEEQCVDAPVALDDGDVFLRKGVGDHLLQRQRDVGNVGRRLEQGGAAGADRTDQGAEQQLDGIVPRGNDQRAAQGFAHDVARGGHSGQGRVLAPGPGPAGDVLQGIANLAIDESDFGHECLLEGLVKVFPERVAEGLFPFLKAGFQRPQLLLAPSDVTGGAGGEKIPLRLHERRDSVGRSIRDLHDSGEWLLSLAVARK